MTGWAHNHLCRNIADKMSECCTLVHGKLYEVCSIASLFTMEDGGGMKVLAVTWPATVQSWHVQTLSTAWIRAACRERHFIFGFPEYVKMFRALQSDCSEQHNATVLHFYSSYRGLKKKAIVNMLSGKVKRCFQAMLSYSVVLAWSPGGCFALPGSPGGWNCPHSFTGFFPVNNQPVSCFPYWLTCYQPATWPTLRMWSRKRKWGIETEELSLTYSSASKLVLKC